MIKPHELNIIVKYVQTYGTTKGVTATLPIESTLTEARILAAVNPNMAEYDFDTAQAISEARDIYEATMYDPSVDVELKKLTRQAAIHMLESGESTVTTMKDEKGRVTGTKEVVKAGIPAWLFNRVFPEKVGGVDSMKILIAAQSSYLANGYGPASDPEVFNTIARFLKSFSNDDVSARVDRDNLAAASSQMQKQIQIPAGLYNPDDEDE